MIRRLLSLAVAVPLLTACPPPPPPVQVVEPAPTTPQTVVPAVDPAERQRALAEAQGALEARIMSHGEERPLDVAGTEAAWARNRRADFIIVAGQVIVSD